MWARACWWWSPCWCGRFSADAVDEPERLGEVEVRFVPSYQAAKRYVCPGCNRVIEAATAHYAVVPTEAPDLRRHWHRGCWDNRPRRRRR